MRMERCRASSWSSYLFLISSESLCCGAYSVRHCEKREPGVTIVGDAVLTTDGRIMVTYESSASSGNGRHMLEI